MQSMRCGVQKDLPESCIGMGSIAYQYSSLMIYAATLSLYMAGGGHGAFAGQGYAS